MKKLRWKGIGGRKDKKLKTELKKPIPLNLMIQKPLEKPTFKVMRMIREEVIKNALYTMCPKTKRKLK